MLMDFWALLKQPWAIRSAFGRRSCWRHVFLLCPLIALAWIAVNPARAQDLFNEVLASEVAIDQTVTVDSRRLEFVPSTLVFASSSTTRNDQGDVWRPRENRDTLAGGPLTGGPGTILAAVVLALLGAIALIVTLPSAAPVVMSANFDTGGAQGGQSRVPRKARNYEQECRTKLAQVSDCWRDAEAAVLNLDVNHPLRTLLEKELSSIAWRLSMYPRLDPAKGGAITQRYPIDYWRVLNREVSQAIRELRRVNATAEAGRDSVGTQSSLPQMPKTVKDAFFVLGINADVTDETLKRLVRALRQCWHPDLAQNTAERDYREARIRQINVANDLISERWKASDRAAG